MKYYKLIQSKRLKPESNVTITCDDSSKELFKEIMKWTDEDFNKYMEACEKLFALSENQDKSPQVTNNKGVSVVSAPLSDTLSEVQEDYSRQHQNVSSDLTFDGGKIERSSISHADTLSELSEVKDED